VRAFELIEFVEASLKEAEQGLTALQNNKEMLARIVTAADLIAASFTQGGHVFSCGNGGSLCDAIHFAEELSGRYRKNRKALGAIAICDPAHITCTANDFGYDEIFSRYLEANARAGDVLVALSTSGKSPNVLKAAHKARQIGMKIIGLTGAQGSEFDRCADLVIVTPAGQFADRVQELHIKVIHILIELIERKLSAVHYL
jgi:D-sedoheptulose 7-phosphate isomerase